MKPLRIRLVFVICMIGIFFMTGCGKKGDPTYYHDPYRVSLERLYVLSRNHVLYLSVSPLKQSFEENFL